MAILLKNKEDEEEEKYRPSFEEIFKVAHGDFTNEDYNQSGSDNLNTDIPSFSSDKEEDSIDTIDTERPSFNDIYKVATSYRGDELDNNDDETTSFNSDNRVDNKENKEEQKQARQDYINELNTLKAKEDDIKEAKEETKSQKTNIEIPEVKQGPDKENTVDKLNEASLGTPVIKQDVELKDVDTSNAIEIKAQDIQAMKESKALNDQIKEGRSFKI